MIKKIQLKKSSKQKLPSRITNDTVAEHRERVLAGGRKLKYPLQYTRHKLVINTVIISFAALVILTLGVWLQLYVFRDSGDVAYRIVRTLPLPVASIDGQPVGYGNYLFYYRSGLIASQSIITRGSEIEVAKDKLEFQREKAMELALQDAYAAKLAKDLKVDISKDQVDKQADEMITRQSQERGLSKEAYTRIIQDNLGWTTSEFKSNVKNTMLRKEAAFKVDDEATKKVASVESLIKQGKSLGDIAEQLGSAVQFDPEVVVPKENWDGGLTTAAAKLKVDEVSGAVKLLSGDGYYFIMRKPSDQSMVSYSYLKVPLTKFKSDFEKIKDSDKTRLYISLK